MLAHGNIRPVRNRKARPVNSVSPGTNAALHILFLLYALACVLPMLVVLSVSLSDESEIVRHGFGLFPRGFTLNAYRFLMNASQNVGTAYWNTIVSTVAGTVLTVLFVSLYAYPLSRKDFRYGRFFTFYNFFTMLFGGGLVPYFIVCRMLGLYNTIYALFIPLAFNPFWVIVMRTFYKTQVPDALVESARIDGATETRTLFQIVLPLSLPGLATVALFSAIGIWNSFFQVLLLTDGVPEYQNLQFMIYRILSNIQFLRAAMTSNAGAATYGATALGDLPSETFRMAMAIVTIGPIILAYPFFQKYFVKGLTIGAIKG